MRTVLSANPGGAQHATLHVNHIAKNVPWHPYDLDDERWVYCPSTLLSNPHLDHDDYVRKLKAACGNDADLLKAWLEGDWNIARGAFFAGSWDERVHVLPVEWPHVVTKAWQPFIAHDYGSAAPSVTYLCLKAPGGVGGFARGSIILLDEVSSADPRDLNVGLNWPPAKICDAITEMCHRWGVKGIHGVADDSKGLETTLIEVFRQHKIYVQRPLKQRVAGWAKMRELMHNAKEQNGRPGFYATARCQYLLKTLPFLPRDPNRPEDIRSDTPDHGLDAARYGAMHLGNEIRSGKHVGMYA